MIAHSRISLPATSIAFHFLPSAAPSSFHLSTFQWVNRQTHTMRFGTVSGVYRLLSIIKTKNIENEWMRSE